MKKINKYGDTDIDSLNGFGIDISLQRTDDLDADLLTVINSSEIKNPRVLDLGCGKGGQTIKMAAANCEVTAVDVQDFSGTIAEDCAKCKVNPEKINFIHSDVRHTDKYLSGEYRFIYSQRTFHYLPYSDCEKLLRLLKLHLSKSIEFNLFISVSGIESELGIKYADRQKPVEERFCLLDKFIADKHKILLPVCLYSMQEFKNLLLACNFKIGKIYLSEFGNIKAIAGG